jgi:hypothetical protein
MIGQLMSDGTVKYARCHYDGYIDGGVGETLYRFYKTPEDISRLFADYRNLPYRELKPEEMSIVCDYGSWDACSNASAWLDNILDEEYLYLYGDGVWKVAKIVHEQKVRLQDFKRLEEFFDPPKTIETTGMIMEKNETRGRKGGDGMRRMPIGIQTFEDIITGGYAYVDKTALVYELANEGRYFFLGRPRRFGKSLLVSTLKAYFEGKRELFAGLAMEKLEKDWPVYPVLHIDLTTSSYGNVRDLESELDTNLSMFEE